MQKVDATAEAASLGLKGVYAAYSFRQEQHENYRWRTDALPWVPYGEDNLYFNQFLDLLATSPLYSQVCERRAQLAVGDGMRFVGDDRDVQAAQSLMMQAGVSSWLEPAARDAATFNAIATRVLYLGNGLPVQMRHMRTANVRVGVNDPVLGEPDSYYYSADWEYVRTTGNVLARYKEYEPLRYPSYAVGPIPGAGIRPAERQSKSISYPTVEGQTVLYTKRYSPAGRSYAQPFGEAAKLALQTQVEIVVYENSLVKNSYASSLIITVKRSPLPDPEKERAEQLKIAEALQKQLANNANAGKATVLFADVLNPANAPEVSSPPTDNNDKRYIEANRMLMESAMTGLGVIAPELYGVFTSSGFSSQADTMRAAFDLAYVSDITHLQDLLCRPINQILAANGIAATAALVTRFPLPDGTTIIRSNDRAAEAAEAESAETVSSDQAVTNAQ